MKFNFRILMVIVVLLAAGNAVAVDPTYTAFLSNKAIKGYDTVAYFTQGKPVPGNEQYATEYQEAVWLFSSPENLQLFRDNPAKYAPQYGGYCAYAVSQNTTASIQPELFTIHEGKLYLNYSKGINKKWLSNMENFIDDADSNWPALLAE